MSTITMQARVGQVRPSRTGRPDRGSARRSAPNGRGRSAVPAPQLSRPAAATPSACAGEPARLRLVAPVVAAPSRLRLTDRGIAVVLVAGAMVVVAALTVVGATALRVTSDHYQPTVISVAR